MLAQDHFKSSCLWFTTQRDLHLQNWTCYIICILWCVQQPSLHNIELGVYNVQDLYAMEISIICSWHSNSHWRGEWAKCPLCWFQKMMWLLATLPYDDFASCSTVASTMTMLPVCTDSAVNDGLDLINWTLTCTAHCSAGLHKSPQENAHSSTGLNTRTTKHQLLLCKVS